MGCKTKLLGGISFYNPFNQFFGQNRKRAKLMNLLLKNVNHVEFLTDGVELILGKCTVFPDLGTGWLINLYLCASCQYPLNWNWKIVHLPQSNSTPPLKNSTIMA